MRFEKFSATEARIIKTLDAIPQREESEVVALADLKVKLTSRQADLALEVARHQKEVAGLNAEIGELQAQVTAIEGVGVVEVEPVPVV